MNQGGSRGEGGGVGGIVEREVGRLVGKEFTL